MKIQLIEIFDELLPIAKNILQLFFAEMVIINNNILKLIDFILGE